ncbi:hypothetical protein HOE31_04050 [bacterium]|jgi:hypothetical protein|nr:hypothetical protein [bacterium]MBT4122091.1 hypothetical protein [bacterium]MBT4335565.1 hypothetical protein [bacterium]MBT4495572.1 hypothetical protein [bacterium]MBT4764230.1 hypothetical protein [bacterium]
MYDKINESIEVVASFKKSEIFPKFFSWRRKIYKVDKVHFIHTSQNGKGLLYHFSVTDKVNYFQLIFNPLTLTWTLSTMYNNG